MKSGWLILCMNDKNVAQLELGLAESDASDIEICIKTDLFLS
jgi:hypothetical protein